MLSSSLGSDGVSPSRIERLYLADYVLSSLPPQFAVYAAQLLELLAGNYQLPEVIPANCETAAAISEWIRLG